MPQKRFFNFNAGRGEIRIGTKIFRLPQRAPARIALGGGLVVGGIFGFLPVLGFWMVPLGLLVLSQDLPVVRRWRRSFVVRMERRGGKRRRRQGMRAAKPKEDSVDMED
ncbi:hypothetical protein WNZ14_13050 [Hoeflea sp. AS60]|uniref:hypothetical protein n=1 Tax=Hoeflea sp. AS60 TaxID=3135780 RepID=UPI00316C0047